MHYYKGRNFTAKLRLRRNIRQRKVVIRELDKEFGDFMHSTCCHYQFNLSQFQPGVDNFEWRESGHNKTNRSCIVRNTSPAYNGRKRKRREKCRRESTKIGKQWHSNSWHSYALVPVTSEGDGLTPSGASQLSTAGIDFFTCLHYDEISRYTGTTKYKYVQQADFLNQEIRQEKII